MAEDTTPPLFDFTTLKSRTVQILLASTAVAALGLNTPLLYMVMITFDQRFVKIVAFDRMLILRSSFLCQKWCQMS